MSNAPMEDGGFGIGRVGSIQDSARSGLDVPGTYLLKITDVELGKGYRDRMDPNSFLVTFVVVGTTKDTSSALEKTVQVAFESPGMSDSDDDRKWKQRKCGRLGVATCQLKESDMTIDSSIYPSKMIGFCVVARFVKNKNGYLTCWSDIWHVDDKRSQGEHLNPAVLAKIPLDQRIDPAELEKCYVDPHKKGSSQAQASGSQPAQQQTSFDDLFK